MVGLDVGSTKVAQALFKARDPLFPFMVANELANRATPAVIAFDASSHRVVGEAADLVKNRGSAMTTLKANVSAGTPSDLSYKGRTVSLTPQHQLAMLLHRVGADLERLEASGEAPSLQPRRCVLAVPPRLAPAAVRGLQQAATVAGYSVVATVYDVSCAALVWAHREALALEAETLKAQSAKVKSQAAVDAVAAAHPAARVLFLDVGHDYASAQVCAIEPSTRTLRVLATEGETCGGSAFGAALVAVWKKELLDKHKVDVDALTGPKRARALQRLQSEAEKAKNLLSGLPEVKVVVDSVVPDLDLHSKVSRGALEATCQPVLDALRALLERTLAAAQVSAGDVDRVEVVGGGCRIPSVLAVAKQLFGEAKLGKTLDSECTVALGAALFGGVAGGPGFLRFTVEGAPSGPAPEAVNAAIALNDEALAAVVALEQEMQADDRAVAAKNSAKNQLEAWVFSVRHDASEAPPGVDAEEALDKLRALLTSCEDWLAEEGEDADAAAVLAKLEEAQRLGAEAAPLLFQVLRTRDEKRRQEAAEAAQMAAAPKEGASLAKRKAHLRPAEKIAEAKAKKDHGNTLYKENNSEDASKRYIQALGICAEMDGTLGPDDQAAVREIQMGCYLNLVLCNLRLKLPKVREARRASRVSLVVLIIAFFPC